jgi:excisionase family DNA binding protein
MMQVLIRAAELAERLHVSLRTLERWRVEGGGPPYTRAGRIVLYDWDDVTAWLRARRVVTDSPARASA